MLQYLHHIDTFIPPSGIEEGWLAVEDEIVLSNEGFGADDLELESFVADHDAAFRYQVHRKHRPLFSNHSLFAMVLVWNQPRHEIIDEHMFTVEK